MRVLSRTFPSVKPRNPNVPSKCKNPPAKVCLPTSPSQAKPRLDSKSGSSSTSWTAYLILSTNKPIKTYVGITTDFCRRLKQHNGEIRGGAKASSAGRPWLCACIIRGFTDQSEASEFESKWKVISRKLHRKKKTEDLTNQTDAVSLALLQHRRTALDKLKSMLDCSHLEIDWKLDPS